MSGQKVIMYIETQAGFPGKSTMDNIFVFQSLISHLINTRKRKFNVI